MSDYSLETTAKQAKDVQTASGAIPPGTRISVAFLPGETLDARIATARSIKRAGFIPVPHISARRLPSHAALEEMLDRLGGEALSESVFVIAGDLPAPKGPFEDSLAIIRSGLLAKYGVQRVGVAGYPEGHPDIPREKLARALLDKSVALAELGMPCEITTQFGFDADPVLAWLKETRDQGVTASIRIGLAGPADMKSLLRFAARCGVSTSTRAFSKYGGSLTRMLNQATPDLLLRALADVLDPDLHGAVKVHLYPFGGLQATAEWARQFLAPPSLQAFA